MLTSVAAQYIPLECQFLASYWALLETKVLTSPHSLLLSIQVPTMPWAGHASQQKLSKASDAFLVKWKFYLQDRAQTTSRIFPNYRRVLLLPCSPPLPESPVELGMVPHFFLSGLLGEPLGTNRLRWESVFFTEGIISNATHGPAASGTSLVEQGTPSSVQLMELVAVQLALKRVAFCRSTFSQTPGLLLMALQLSLAIPPVFRNA